MHIGNHNQHQAMQEEHQLCMLSGHKNQEFKLSGSAYPSWNARGFLSHVNFYIVADFSIKSKDNQKSMFILDRKPWNRSDENSSFCNKEMMDSSTAKCLRWSMVLVLCLDLVKWHLNRLLLATYSGFLLQDKITETANHEFRICLKLTCLPTWAEF